jgi:hypothetical protein
LKRIFSSTSKKLPERNINWDFLLEDWEPGFVDCSVALFGFWLYSNPTHFLTRWLSMERPFRLSLFFISPV